METLVLTSVSKSDLSLIYKLAKKMGVNAKRVSNEDLEDSALLLAMKNAKTGEYINTNSFLENLRK
jgi:hypothetical protein